MFFFFSKKFFFIIIIIHDQIRSVFYLILQIPIYVYYIYIYIHIHIYSIFSNPPIPIFFNLFTTSSNHLSLPTHHFVSQKLYLFLPSYLSRVTWNIYLFLSLCPAISIFSYPLVYPPTKVVFIFFSIFRDRPLVYFSIPHLSPHSANFNLSLYPSVSIFTANFT